MPALADDQPRRDALRVHRVPGDERALQVQHLEQRRQRPDLVGLLVDRDLAEHDARPRGEGAQEMQRRELRGARERAPERLAVDRDLPDARRLQSLRPAPSEPGQRGRERARIHHPEQPGEGVVAGKPVLQTHELAQKPLVEDGEIRHVDAGLTAAQARKQRDHQHFVEVVARRVAGPGILDPLEKFAEFFHVLPLFSARSGRRRLFAEQYEAREILMQLLWGPIGGAKAGISTRAHQTRGSARARTLKCDCPVHIILSAQGLLVAFSGECRSR